jgi:hypothetical protein
MAESVPLLQSYLVRVFQKKEKVCALLQLHRPYGANQFDNAHPALKRWANIRCAYGAVPGHCLRNLNNWSFSEKQEQTTAEPSTSLRSASG